MNEPIGVLVIGAGPVGLTFACEMARYGVPCRIVDKAQGTKEISKALILHVRTQEVLDAMGLTRELQQAAVPLRRVDIIGYGKHLGQFRLSGKRKPPALNRTAAVYLSRCATLTEARKQSAPSMSLAQTALTASLGSRLL